MARPPQQPIGSYYPEARCNAPTFSIGSKLLMFRGLLKSFQHKEFMQFPKEVAVFDGEVLSWKAVKTAGEIPRWFQGAAVATFRDNAYYFGGDCGVQGFCNELFALNFKTFLWKRMVGTGQMLRTVNSGLVSLFNGNLLTSGGFAEYPTYQPTTGFIPNPGNSKRRGWTGQLLQYSRESGEWSTPSTTGNSPPPSTGMTLTRVDRRRVVWFGGYDGEKKRMSNAVFILDTLVWHWTGPILPQSQNDPWPEERKAHTAYSMWDPDFDQPHPCIVMMGGVSTSGEPLGDVWLLHINVMQWKEICLPPESMTPRFLHGGGVILLSPTRKMVVAVAGVSDNVQKYMSFNDYPLLSETTVLEFGWEEERDMWTLINVLSGPKLENERQRRESECMLLQQMQKGYVMAEYTICAVSGAPGAGKTSLGHFLCNETLPPARTSTACMERAKRFVIEIKDGQGRRCRQLSPSDMVDMIAENLSAGVSITEEEPSTSAIQVASQHIYLPMSSSAKMQTEPQHLLKREQRAVFISDVQQPSMAFSSTRDASVSATVRSEAAPSAASRAEVLPRTTEIARKMTKMKVSREVLKAHFLLFVDCGGQPHFMEMIPILMKNAFLRMQLFKLSEELKDRPAVDYYAPNGANYSLGHFALTNAELILRCMQMTQSQHSQLPMSFIEKQPEHPKSMVIGTFKDKLQASVEPLEDKNDKLATMLERFKKYLIKYSQNEVIYAVNNAGSGPGVPRDPMAEKLLQMIESCGQSIRLKYPLAYYLLEMELRRAGRIVSRAECWAIAQQLMFESEEAMDVALQFFHAVNLMFYFPAVVKEVIFVDPMALLDWMTNVFEKSLEAMDAPEGDVQTEETIRLRNQALITSSFLQSLQTEITSEGVTVAVDALIKVLEHLLILAPVQEENDTKYFMPSLLDSRDSSEIARPNGGAAATLRIKFSSENVPSGVLCCLIVYMMSSRGVFQWQIPLHHSEEATRLLKNDLHFTLTEYDSGITVMDDDTHYSVYVDSDCSPELLPLIWNDISQGISDVCRELSLTVTHRMGFDCLCDKPYPHLAVVSPDRKSWKCTEDVSMMGTLSKKQKLWLPVQADQETVFFHHTFDAANPTVYSLCNPWNGWVTSDGGTISLKEIGIEIHIPPGAVAKGKWLQLKVQAIVNGPFNLPEGYKMTSPVYMMTPGFEFEKEVTLSVTHYATLDSKSSCDDMTFVLSSSPPAFTPQAKYEFNVVGGGIFRKNDNYGVIHLKYLCHTGIAKRARTTGVTDVVKDFSTDIYESNATFVPKTAGFKTSQHQPVSTKTLREPLEQMFPEKRCEGSDTSVIKTKELKAHDENDSKDQKPPAKRLWTVEDSEELKPPIKKLKTVNGDSEPELRDLVKLNISDWYDVGLQLKLKPCDLDCIEESDPLFKTRKRKMFNLWLHYDSSPSYRTLVTALFEVGENKIATEICTKCGIDTARTVSN